MIERDIGVGERATGKMHHNGNLPMDGLIASAEYSREGSRYEGRALIRKASEAWGQRKER